MQALERAGAGHGQVVAVVGEAGVGKSRLVYECIHSHHTQGWRVLESASVSYGWERLAPERLAEWASGRSPDQVDLLAHHALRGEVWDKAVAYGRQAGTRAMARLAYRKAVTAFEQALMALEHLPESRARHKQAIDIRRDLRSALLPLGEHARMFDHVCAAEPLAEALSDSHRLCLISHQMCYCFSSMGDHERAIATAQRACALATASGTVDLHIVVALMGVGALYRCQGDLSHLIPVFQRGLALCQEANMLLWPLLPQPWPWPMRSVDAPQRPSLCSSRRQNMLPLCATGVNMEAFALARSLS